MSLERQNRPVFVCRCADADMQMGEHLAGHATVRERVERQTEQRRNHLVGGRSNVPHAPSQTHANPTDDDASRVEHQMRSVSRTLIGTVDADAGCVRSHLNPTSIGWSQATKLLKDSLSQLGRGGKTFLSGSLWYSERSDRDQPV